MVFICGFTVLILQQVIPMQVEVLEFMMSKTSNCDGFLKLSFVMLRQWLVQVASIGIGNIPYTDAVLIPTTR